MFASPLEVMPNVKSGRLSVIAVTSAKRVPYWPDVPTLNESGYPNYEAYAWFGVVAPAATPRDIIAKINATSSPCLKTPAVAESLAAQGADVRDNHAGGIRALPRCRACALVVCRQSRQHQDRVTL